MEMDEVEHRPVGDAVDGVAERAADDQPEGGRDERRFGARLIQSESPMPATSETATRAQRPNSLSCWNRP